MKVQGAKKVHYDSGPNMTPLVDVVMVILIFLMLAGSFGSDEHYMVSKTPIHMKGGGDKKVDPADVPKESIQILVNRNGDFTLPRGAAEVTVMGSDGSPKKDPTPDERLQA